MSKAVKKFIEELNKEHEIILGFQEYEKKIADLEAKLAESEKALEAKESVNQMYKATLSLKDSDFSDLVRENAELKQQLAEKEKRCEICGSKMILGELGYYCNNDELHPIYQTPNEAKSDYEKITLLKQDYDAMVEREELLRQQLAEKDKEIETKNIINNLYKATVSLRDNDFKDLVYENNSLKQQLKSQPAEIVEKIKEIAIIDVEEYSNDTILYKITEEELDTILKEYQK